MRRIVFLAFLCIVSLYANATGKISATVVKINGERIVCSIEAYEGKILSEDMFSIWIDREKSKIERSEIKEVLTGSGKYEIIDYSYETRQGNRVTTMKVLRLAELLVDGKVKLYAAYSTEASATRPGPNGLYSTTGRNLVTDNYLVSSDQAASITQFGFKGTVKKFFPQCPELANKIKSGELKFEQRKQVVTIGNSCN